MTRIALNSLVVASVLAAGSVPAGAGELRGRILIGDRPAAGVTVAAVPYEAPLDAARREARRLPPAGAIATAATTADGSYVIAVAAVPGKETFFVLRIGGGGAAAGAIAGLWEAGESLDLGDHDVPQGAKLTGKVVDPSGAPVPDAEVTLRAQLDRFGDPELEAVPVLATTAADGTFHLDGASATGNVVTVDKPGRLVARLSGVRAGPLPAPVVLGTGAPVSGSVRRPDAKSPAAGALVRVEGRVTTRWVEAAADGSFTIANAPAGAVIAVADLGEAGYLEQPSVRLPLAQGKGLALVLQPVSSLVGRTVDAKTGRPVPRARVEVRAAGASRQTRSGPDGSYALRGLPPRSWQLRADEPRYVPWTHAGVSVRPGETKTLDVPLVLGASISGRVTDEAGQPVANAAGVLSAAGPVSLQRLVRRLRAAEAPAFRTRADGAFSATRLSPGESQILTVSHPDFEAGTLGGLTLAPGGVKAGLALVLKRGAVVAGAVKDGNGQPVAGAGVALARSFGFGGGRGRAMVFAGPGGGAAAEKKSESTGADGAFALRGVAPGDYSLTVTRSGYATTRVDPVKVPKAGSPPAIQVTLGPGASISGRVARGNGADADGFIVRATVPGQPPFAAAATGDQPTGVDGGFAVDGLKPGEAYDLELFGPTGPLEGKRGVVAPASGVVITVAGPGRITGTARDAADGHPITEFQVSYEPDRGGGRGGLFIARVMTGGAAGGAGRPVDVQSPDGTFAIEDVPAGTWSVVVSAKGYQTSRAGGVVVAEGASRDGVEVRVTKGTVVKGHVADATTAAPVANATVSLAAAGATPGRGMAVAQAADGDATTDADGRFEIDGVAPGKQTLHVTQPDYADATQSIDVADDMGTVEVRMTQGGAVAGVVASDTGQPVPGATVDLAQAGSGGPGLGFALGAGGSQTLTDSAGGYRFDHLGAGRFTVTASLGSHTSAAAQVVLQAGQSQEGVALQLQLGVTIQGTVSGLPATMLSGMTVNASGPDSYFQSSRLGGDGGFEFDNVPVGVVTLHGTATDPSGSTRSATKQVTTTGDQPVVTAELVFDQGYTLSGTVTQSGQPVAGAMVFAALQGGGGRQASSSTDDSGSYRLTGLQDGTYTVMAISALAGTGSSKRQTITLSSDQTLDIAFPSAKLAGEVVDANGNMPLANATVTIAEQQVGSGMGGQRPATTDSNGQFSFSGLDEATYTLTTTRPDFQLDTRDVAATDQGTDGLVVALKRGAGIGIKVVDGLAGVPLPAVMVRVFDPQSAPVFGPSSIALDSEGQGEIPSLPPGRYSVIASASGYAPARLDGVAVPSANVTIALTPGGSVLIQAGPKTLASGTASGTIATAAGQPALLSLFNLQGRIAISEPNVQLRNVPPGSYILSLPGVSVTQTFVVGEGAPSVVTLP